MASPTVQALKDEITRNTAVDGSAIALLNGVQARVDDGIAAALAAGASETEMAELQVFSDELKANSDALAAAVAANTPAAARR